MTQKWGYRAAINDAARLRQTASTRTHKDPQARYETKWQLATEKHMTYVTSFEQICIDKGMQAGRQEGLQTCEALALQKLLAKRFGALSTETISQIASASTAQIDAWLDVVLDAPSLDVMFGSSWH